MKIVSKTKLKYALITLLALTFTLILINSCKKNLTSTTINDPKILQAKVWYETNYPKSNKGTSSLKTLSTDNTSGTTPFSDLVGPDWEHNASYSRLGKDVIEMPLDPTSKYNFGLKAFNKAYCRTSFLILNDGKQYRAFIMLIAADSAYVNNDLTKLSNNTYRKHDADFSGSVIYFTPQGKLIGHFIYKNGQLLPPGSNLPQPQGTQQTQSLKTQEATVVYSITCVDTYEAHYYNGVLVSTDLISSVCSIDGITYIGSGGGDGDGGGASTAPICPPITNSINNKLIVNTAGGDPIGGPPPPDGGYPDPTTTYNTTSNPCVVPVDNTSQNLAFKIEFCTGLTDAQKEALTQTISTFMTEDCVSKFLTVNFKDKTFTFCISNADDAPQADFVPNPNDATQINITFGSDYTATRPDILLHEMFHVYQNATYGGISAYGKNPSTGVNSPGFANIEFEEAVFYDIVNGTRSAFYDGTDEQRIAYDNWIKGVTANQTVYPKLNSNDGTTSYSDFMTQYNSFLSQYAANPSNPNHSDVVTLVPNSIVNIFNNTNPVCP